MLHHFHLHEVVFSLYIDINPDSFYKREWEFFALSMQIKLYNLTRITMAKISCVQLNQKYSCSQLVAPWPTPRVHIRRRIRFQHVNVRCVQKTADPLEMEIPRRSANYRAPICDHDFLQSLHSRYGVVNFSLLARILLLFFL